MALLIGTGLTVITTVMVLKTPTLTTVVYIGHLVEDPGTGEETEVVEAVPCFLCTSRGTLWSVVHKAAIVPTEPT